MLTKDDEQRFLDADRQLMLIHFRALTDRIAQLEDRKGDQAAERTQLVKKLETERVNQEDIFEYLRGEIHNKNNQITDYQEKTLTLEKEKEDLITENETERQAERDQVMEDKVRSEAEVTKLKDELHKVKTFISMKAEMESDLAEKNRLLEANQKAHTTAIADLERKHVQEKDRLKKEMLTKLRETKSKLLQMTDNQLDTTTKRTIAENEQMSSELAWQSRETEKLIRRNDKLTKDNSALKRELGLHQQTQEDFARKVSARSLHHSALQLHPFSSLLSLSHTSPRLLTLSHAFSRPPTPSHTFSSHQVSVYQKTIKTLLAKLNHMDATQQVTALQPILYPAP